MYEYLIFQSHCQSEDLASFFVFSQFQAMSFAASVAYAASLLFVLDLTFDFDLTFIAHDMCFTDLPHFSLLNHT